MNGKSFKDTLLIYRAIFSDIYSIFADIFSKLLMRAKNTMKNRNKAAKNNFRLALEMLKKNMLSDAKFRFKLTNLLYPESPVNQYYLAYTSYLQSRPSEVIYYINKLLNLGKKHNKRAALLLEKMEKTHSDFIKK